jgi:hypothetical protein
MKYVLNQYQGLGDILFCEPIANHFYNNGQNEIIWPVNPEFLWIRDYIKYVNFVDKTTFNINYEDFEIHHLDDETMYIPLRFANPIYRGLSPHDYSDQFHTMLDKYRFLNLSTNLWKTTKWERNFIKEDELFNKVVKDNNYILVNSNWSNGNFDFSFLDSNKKIVHMDKIENFNLLDWGKIIENADEIHTVSTSNLYMIETLNLKTDKVYIYPRVPLEHNLDGINEFVNKNFKLITI